MCVLREGVYVWMCVYGAEGVGVCMYVCIVRGYVCMCIKRVCVNVCMYVWVCVCVYGAERACVCK